MKRSAAAQVVSLVGNEHR